MVKAALACATCVLVLGIADPQPVNAQEQETEGAGGSPQGTAGVFTFSRDVPYGAATARNFDGQANTVQIDQSELIESSLLNGMKPLSAGEAAAISAPLATMRTVIDRSLASVGFGQEGATGRAGPTDTSPVALGGQISGSLQNGMGALSSALSSLRGAMGSEP